MSVVVWPQFQQIILEVINLMASDKHSVVERCADFVWLTLTTYSQHVTEEHCVIRTADGHASHLGQHHHHRDA